MAQTASALTEKRSSVTGMLLFLALSGFSANSLSGGTLEGKVISVADGDTLTILQSGKAQTRIRLAEIDAPESGQDFGRQSKQSLSQMCAGKAARVKVAGQDRYKRTIGRVFCGEYDVSAEQVRRGMAWVYTKYSTDPVLPKLQDQASSEKRGLWSHLNPVPPWQWRKGKRDAAVLDQAASSNQAATIRGNTKSRVYHLTHCPSYGKVSVKNVQNFASEEAALAAGYRRAGNCR